MQGANDFRTPEKLSSLSKYGFFSRFVTKNENKIFSPASWSSQSSKTYGAQKSIPPTQQLSDLFKPPPPPPPKPPPSVEEVQKTAQAIYNAIKEAQEMITKKDRNAEDLQMISQWPPTKPKKDRKTRWTDADVPTAATGSNAAPMGGKNKLGEPPAKKQKPKTYYQLEPGEVPPPWWQPPLPTSRDPGEADAPIPGELVDENAPIPEIVDKKRDMTKIVDKSKGWNSEISKNPPPSKPLSVADLFASDMGKGLDPLNLEGFRHPGMDPYLFAPKAPQVGPRIPRDMLPKFYPPTLERGFQLPDFLTPDKINPDALAMMAKNYEEWLKTQSPAQTSAGLPLMGLPTSYPNPYEQGPPKEEDENVEHMGDEKMMKKKKNYVKKVNNFFFNENFVRQSRRVEKISYFYNQEPILLLMDFKA